MSEIYDFYNAGAEIGRLERGLGRVEFYRTKEILAEYIKDGSVIYDVGGGIGVYSAWLAKRENEVHLLELADNAVNYAKENMMNDCEFIAETGDARHIDRPDNSADVVLLMGPLYHLQNSEDRAAALNEAYRVLKDGGLLIAAGISKFSSTTWALSVYGECNDYIDDPIFFDMLRGELTMGNHNRPKEYPYLIAESYFATPKSFAAEMGNIGFEVVNFHAVEGCIWFTPHLDEKWEDEASRKRLLEIVHLTEHEEEIIGMSPHFLVVAKKIIGRFYHMNSAEMTVNAAKSEFEKSFKEEKFYNKQTQDDKHLNLLLSKLELSDGMKILDLGTGSGYLAFALAAMNPNAEVIGLDVVEETLQRNDSRAKSKGLTNIKFCSYDGIEFPFDDGGFDYVITRYALHHFPKIDITFREISRVLKKGGRLIISDPTPNEDDTDKFVDEFMQMKPDGHIRFYSLAEFVELAEKADLRFVSNQHTEIRFPRQNASAYILILSRYDENVINNYNVKIEGDEIYITEKVLNTVFEKD